MKRIAAFFAFILMSISAFCLSVSAAEDTAEKAKDEAAPLLEGIITPENTPLIIGVAVGAFVVLAIIFLAISHSRSRKKYMAKREKKKEEAKMRAMIQAKLAGEDLDGDDQANDPYAYDPYYAYYYGYAPQQAQPAAEEKPAEEKPVNHPTYKTLQDNAVEIPAQDIAEVKPLVAQKPVKAVAMVQPVVVKDLVTVPRDCPKCKTVKLEDAKKDTSKVKKIAATVAITAIGCHLLGKLKK